MTQDVQNSPDGKQPAFYYHLGDVIYFAGDIDKYGAYFYETYKNYPAFIVSIPGESRLPARRSAGRPGRSQQGPARWLGAKLHVQKSGATGFTENRRESHANGLAQCVLDLHDSIRNHHRIVLQRE